MKNSLNGRETGSRSKQMACGQYEE